ncbi:MAG: hypothetical protein EOO38_01430 [Cytophagaceae bacterium]|nr:MAG: hypothetical protein EOO38_01430 [Cytophagaceae bacterium]
MEFEDLDQKVQWEARRVAAAFGVESFTASGGHATLTNFYASEGEVSLWWALDSRREKTMLRVLDITTGNQRCQVSVTKVLGNVNEEDKWVLIDQGVLREEMAGWLYCLGFDDENVLSRLPALTMHEKMELRLSISREFWSQKWRDEEATQ